MEEITKTENNHTQEWVLAILSVAYALLPIDIIPDIPIIGWVDDFFITSAGVLNLIQSHVGNASQSLARLVGFFKWLVIIFGVIAISLVLLVGTLIVKMLS